MKRFLEIGVLILSMLLSGCSSSGPVKNQSPPIPAYPDASVRTMIIQKADMSKGVVITRFETSDSPEVIRAWYQKTLIEHGWDLSPMTEPTNRVTFYDPSQCIPYHVSIITMPLDSTTQVEITTWASGCM